MSATMTDLPKSFTEYLGELDPEMNFRMEGGVLSSAAYAPEDPQPGAMCELYSPIWPEAYVDLESYGVDDPALLVHAEYALATYSFTPDDLAAIFGVYDLEPETRDKWLEDNYRTLCRALTDAMSGYGYGVDFFDSMGDLCQLEFSAYPESFGMTPETVSVDAMAHALRARLSGTERLLWELMETPRHLVLNSEQGELDMSALDGDED